MIPSGGNPKKLQGEPLITVSIVSHGHAAELRPLLESLVRYEPPQRIELIVTDNLGHDLPPLELGSWHSTLLVRNPRPRGFASNHNAAFADSHGDYFCVLNPDVVFLQAVLLQLIRRLDQGQGHIVAPLVVNSSGDVQDSFRTLPYPADLVKRRIGQGARIEAPAKDALLRPDWIAGTFMLMGRETFSRLGGFDPRYRLYFEDVDLCTRARLMGLGILLDGGLRLQHDPRRASRRINASLLWHVEGALRFFTSDVYRRARVMAPHA